MAPLRCACLRHALWACRGLRPLDPWGYIPVANINILFIPVPNILFIPVSHILFIPVSSTFFIPVPYILFIPVANTLCLSQSTTYFLSQSAAHSLSQPATYSYISVSNTFFIPVLHIPVLHTSLFLLLPEPKLLRSDLHVSFSTYSLYQPKSYRSYNLKPKSCVLLFCLDIIYHHFFYLLYFITILISLPLSPSLFYHLHIYPSSCLLSLSLFAIINSSLTFYSPLLFLAYFIIYPFLPLSSPFFFHQSSSSCSHSSIFLSKYFHIFFLSTFTFSCLLLFVFPTYSS